MGVEVGVGATVGVAVEVGVGATVGVAVEVGVGATVGVDATEGVGVGARVGIGVATGVGVGVEAPQAESANPTATARRTDFKACIIAHALWICSAVAAPQWG